MGKPRQRLLNLRKIAAKMRQRGDIRQALKRLMHIYALGLTWQPFFHTKEVKPWQTK